MKDKVIIINKYLLEIGKKRLETGVIYDNVGNIVSLNYELENSCKDLLLLLESKSIHLLKSRKYEELQKAIIIMKLINSIIEELETI